MSRVRPLDVRWARLRGEPISRSQSAPRWWPQDPQWRLEECAARTPVELAHILVARIQSCAAHRWDFIRWAYVHKTSAAFLVEETYVVRRLMNLRVITVQARSARELEAGLASWLAVQLGQRSRLVRVVHRGDGVFVALARKFDGPRAHRVEAPLADPPAGGDDAAGAVGEPITPAHQSTESPTGSHT